MAWTEFTRPQYRRDGLRYASDGTDEEWALIELLLSPPCERGRPRETAMREVVNAMFYIAQSGCHWRMLLIAGVNLLPCRIVRQLALTA
jgi:hypothetical protein